MSQRTARVLVPSARSATSTQGRARAGVVLTLVSLAALTGVTPASGLRTSVPAREFERSAAHSASSEAAPAWRDAPTTPPARICGSKSLLGPSKRPAGAKVVSTNNNLQDVALDAPEGTTFWLKPGVHHLNGDEFAQVQPREGQTFIGAPGAVLDGGGVNLYAFTTDVANVTIKYLTIQNFVAPSQEGVVNHDYGEGWVIEHNTIRENNGAGVFLGSHTVVAHNCLVRNGQYGFSSPGGQHDIVLRHNEIARNNADDIESQQPGCGCSGAGKFWDTRNVKVVRNYVHDNRGVGIWADTNNTGFLIKKNFIARNDGEGIIYETSYNARIESNTFLRNAIPKGPTDQGFPIPAVYLSESGSDVRAGKLFGQTFDVIGNRFINNWSGIFGWENADRFAGSLANASTGYTTLVNPSVATVEACGDPDLIGTNPYFDDCRWKVQHLRVTGNLFKVDRGAVGPTCTHEAGCGFSGLVSQYGTVPDWSPYKAYVVSDNITFEQDNIWSNNTYRGPWSFRVHELGKTVTWKVWRASPYGQDAGSTRR